VQRFAQRRDTILDGGQTRQTPARQKVRLASGQGLSDAERPVDDNSELSYRVVGQQVVIYVIWDGRRAGKTLFEVIDFVAGNLLAPVGALLTCLLTGWRLNRTAFESELRGAEPLVRRTCRALLPN
jgi:hypothetical protein